MSSLLGDVSCGMRPAVVSPSFREAGCQLLSSIQGLSGRRGQAGTSLETCVGSPPWLAVGASRATQDRRAHCCVVGDELADVVELAISADDAKLGIPAENATLHENVPHLDASTCTRPDGVICKCPIPDRPGRAPKAISESKLLVDLLREPINLGALQIILAMLPINLGADGVLSAGPGAKRCVVAIAIQHARCEVEAHPAFHSWVIDLDEGSD